MLRSAVSGWPDNDGAVCFLILLRDAGVLSLQGENGRYGLFRRGRALPVGSSGPAHATTSSRTHYGRKGDKGQMTISAIVRCRYHDRFHLAGIIRRDMAHSLQDRQTGPRCQE
jgi:hypothetical protein